MVTETVLKYYNKKKRIIRLFITSYNPRRKVKKLSLIPN